MEEQFMTETNAENLLTGRLSGRIISMTGTETKHEAKLNLYKNLGLKVLYKISINEAVDIKLLSDYTIKVLEIDLGTAKTIEAGNKNKKWMTSEAAQYAYLNSTANQAMYQRRKDAMFRIMERMRFIKDSPSKLNAAIWLKNHLEGRKLMFCSNINQAEALCEYTYHSKTDDTYLKQFQSGDLDEIAMVNAGGTGFTYKAIDHQFIVQADSDKNGLTSQKVCRTLLSQKGYHATIWVLVLLGTQDENWVSSTLANFDETKIEYVRFKNLLNGRI